MRHAKREEKARLFFPRRYPPAIRGNTNCAILAPAPVRAGLDRLTHQACVVIITGSRFRAHGSRNPQEEAPKNRQTHPNQPVPPTVSIVGVSLPLPLRVNHLRRKPADA